MNTVSDRNLVQVKHKLPNPCGAHVLARALKRHGVEVIFGQSLPSPLHLVLPESGMRQIAYRTENAGGAMAGFGDGAVRFLPEAIDVTVHRALHSIHGGETVSAP